MYQHVNYSEDIFRDELYGLEGDFFVTLCALPSSCMLSNVAKGKTILSKAGKLVKKTWLDIEKHFLNMRLREFVVMPNHIHGIISIDNTPLENIIIPDIARYEMSFGSMVGRHNPFMIKGSIFHAVSWFKASSFIEIRRSTCEDFNWKHGYFNQRILNDTSYNNVRNYIVNDPRHWEDDIDNPSNNFRKFIYPSSEIR